jgi:hypothetical protein
MASYNDLEAKCVAFVVDAAAAAAFGQRRRVLLLTVAFLVLYDERPSFLALRWKNTKSAVFLSRAPKKNNAPPPPQWARNL